MAVPDKSCSPGTCRHRGSIFQFARSSAVSTSSSDAKCPKPGNATIRREQPAQSMLVLPPSPALVRFLSSGCQHQVWCPNITPSSAVATTAKPTQPAANACKKSHLQGRKNSLLPSLKALPEGRQQEPEHCTKWWLQESCSCAH